MYASAKDKQSGFAFTAALFIPVGKGAGAAKVVLQEVAEHGTIEVAEKAVVEESPRLLQPASPDLTQKSLEHIVERHWFTSTAKGAGKFAQGTTARSLKQMIETAVEKGVFRANTGGRAGTIAEYDFGRAIGTTSAGAVATKLRVVISAVGHVITAFPF